MATLTCRVNAWKEKGHTEIFKEHKVHCYYQDGKGPLLVIFHGYPTCSYDWFYFINLEQTRPILVFDFLVFGLSDKHTNHKYSLQRQADLAEEMILRHNKDMERPIFLIAHDMGTSIASEIFARDTEETLRPGINLQGALLFNGNMLMERSNLILGQRLLRSPLGSLAAKLTFSAAFRWQLGTVFSRAHPMTREEGEDQWALMSHQNGHRINDKLIQYTFERVERAERWLGGVRDWNKPLAFAWGMDDPVATTFQLDGWKQLRPQAKVYEISGLAHYPQIEDPKMFKNVLETILEDNLKNI